MTKRIEADKLKFVEMCKQHLRGQWLRYVLSGRRLKLATDKVTISQLQLLNRKGALLKSAPEEWAREVKAHESLASAFRQRRTRFAQSTSRLEAEALRLLYNGDWVAWGRIPNCEGLARIPASEWFAANIHCDGRVVSFTLAKGAKLKGLQFAIAGPKPKQDTAVYDALNKLGLTSDKVFDDRGAIERIADQILNTFPHIGKRSSIVRKLGDIKRERKRAR